MAIKRAEFKSEYRINKLPDWLCPTCSKGVLKKYNKYFKTYENDLSSSLRVNPDWEPGWGHGVFSGILLCSNPNCKETIAITGHFRCEEEIDFDKFGNAGLIINKFISPNLITPPLQIFQIHESIPEIIKDEILKAFSLFWLDLASCANKIRIVVELIMDDKKVRKTYLDNRSKRKQYNLHTRIDLFKNKYPDEAKLLIANKWIGNAGSHKNQNLSKDNILDGFEILELVLNNLYVKDKERITAKAAKIIRSGKNFGK